MTRQQVVSILRKRVATLEAYTAALEAHRVHMKITICGWECLGECKSLRQCLERRAKETEAILTALHKLQRTPGEPKATEEDQSWQSKGLKRQTA